MRDRILPRQLEVRQSAIREITRKVESLGGINLGQGTCCLPPHPAILEAACQAIRDGHNQYTFFDGVPELKRAVVERCRAYNGLAISTRNVLITGGATGAFECVCKCFLEAGDEVVLLAPVYQYHVRQVVERGAVPKFVHLRPPDWRIDPDELRAALTPRTKLFVFSNPNNPTGRVFSMDELALIGDACRGAGVVPVSDEVYEYVLSPAARHHSLASLPGMQDHALTISSASKTFFVTGWRVGWLIGPEEVMQPLGIKSDETYVCAPAPLQHAVARGLRLEDSFFRAIQTPFHRKKRVLADALVAAGFQPQNPEGAYYMLAGYSDLGFRDDSEAADALVDQTGVGSVPGSCFFPAQQTTGFLRFCYAVPDETLSSACARLSRFGNAPGEARGSVGAMACAS